MTIRPATIADADAIAALFVEQFDVMASLQPYFNRSGTQDMGFIRNTITGDDSAVFVAEDGGRVVGFVSVFEKKAPDFNFRLPHRYAYVMDIIVTETRRGEGIATALMDEVRRWAAGWDLEYISLDVFANNPAVEFYHKNGFGEIMRTMVCKL